jgi:SagB-type dehydrogenase family enzyme
MSELQPSIANYYHERTKYDPETIASKNKGLDWDNQPIPFKEYKIGKICDLKPYLSQEIDAVADPNAYNWLRLSRLLLCSYGLTAKLPTMGAPVYLRAAPSAGGLYPAEVYLISRRTSCLEAGLYNYQPQTHSLVHFWESDLWSSLQEACFGCPVLENTHLAIVTTAIFYRSSWRYEDRAYRRIFLDTGHLLGNIELAAAFNDYRPHLIGGFRDRAIDNLLYLNPLQESTIAVVALADLSQGEPGESLGRTALASVVKTDYSVVADGELLYYFHQATQIEELTVSEIAARSNLQEPLEDKYNFPFCSKISTATKPINWEVDLSGLENTMLRRRSTRAYTGANISLEELKALLNFTYQPQEYLDLAFDDSPDYFDLNLLETFVAVSGVEELEEGCYYYAPKVQELRQIRFKNFRSELHFLCLGQELGRDAAAVIFHTADLTSAIAKYGDRAYRYLHMDAGHLGQKLNLAAIYLGLGVSGIGGFFDDRVNEILGIPASEAAIYITTIGRPRKG